MTVTMMKKARTSSPGLFLLYKGMKNFWLDRAKARKEKEAPKEKFIYPKHLWHYVSKVLQKRKKP